jgi:hypothetical protein
MMVDYFQPTKYPDSGFQLKVVHKRVHFTTNPGLWLNLSRYLRDAGCIKFIFMLPRAGGSVGLHAYFNARLRKYVDRPAEILGLNKEQVRRRIMFYNPYCPCGRCVENPFWGTSAPDSFLVYLARNKDYDTLALRVLIADRVTIEAVFGDEVLKNKITGETASLKDLVQTAREKIRDTWMDSIPLPAGTSSNGIVGDYRVGNIPHALSVIPRHLFNRCRRS